VHVKINLPITRHADLSKRFPALFGEAPRSRIRGLYVDKKNNPATPS
jgi:hypothetical protein